MSHRIFCNNVFREICVVREKGDGLDYRFTPEPNLPRLRIEEIWVTEAQQKINTVPDYFDYIHTYHMQASEAIELVVRILFYLAYKVWRLEACGGCTKTYDPI